MTAKVRRLNMGTLILGSCLNDPSLLLDNAALKLRRLPSLIRGGRRADGRSKLAVDPSGRRSGENAVGVTGDKVAWEELEVLATDGRPPSTTWFTSIENWLSVGRPWIFRRFFTPSCAAAVSAAVA